LNRFGFETLLVLNLPNPRQRFDQVVLGTRWPSEWSKIYNDGNYIHGDPVLRHLRGTDRPFEWRDVHYDPEREPRAAELMRLRQEFGFGRTVVVPAWGQAGQRCCVSMSGIRPELDGCIWPTVHLMASYAFHRVSQLRAHRAVRKPELTPREHEVLTWVAHGKSAWEIGEILAIAKRTVDEHAQTAFRKLGAVNRTHAVALALRDRLIAL
jgi:LuxR family quorum sensing-dependent transcriptional regulator